MWRGIRAVTASSQLRIACVRREVLGGKWVDNGGSRCSRKPLTRLSRGIFYENRHNYFSQMAELKKIQNEGISASHADVLYSQEHFTKAVEYLVNKKFDLALPKLLACVDQLEKDSNDFPDILATILKRIAICQLNLGMDTELLQTLKEIFIIRTSDTNTNMYQIFMAAYNLGVCLAKQDPQSAVKFLEDVDQLIGNVVLPLPLSNELKLILGSAYVGVGNTTKAKEIWLLIAQDPRSSKKVRGFSQNNAAVVHMMEFLNTDMPNLRTTLSEASLREFQAEIEVKVAPIRKMFLDSLSILEGKLIINQEPDVEVELQDDPGQKSDPTHELEDFIDGKTEEDVQILKPEASEENTSRERHLISQEYIG
jgi:hypothetical protein